MRLPVSKHYQTPVGSFSTKLCQQAGRNHSSGGGRRKHGCTQIHHLLPTTPSTHHLQQHNNSACCSTRQQSNTILAAACASAALATLRRAPKICRIWVTMSTPFLLKVQALGFPNPHAFNASDPQQYRTLVVFLENEKVRCLPPADRSSLVKCVSHTTPLHTRAREFIAQV